MHQMEAEYKDNYGEQYYPATLDLNRELAWAIQEGGLDRIVAALEDQVQNTTTESVSNALLRYDFLNEGMQDLIELSDAIEHAGTAKEILEETGYVLKDIEERFEAVFYREETIYQYAALKGDNYLRSVLYLDDADVIENVRRMITKNVIDLPSPEDMYDEMSGLKLLITSDLRVKTDILWQEEASESSLDSLLETIDHYIGLIDEKLSE